MRRPSVSTSEITNASAERTPSPASLVPAAAPYTAVAAAGAPDANLALFMQAARDPAVDVVKLERLMALRQQVEEDGRKRAFYAALAAAKGEFTPILKTRKVDYPHKDREDREGGGRTKYAYEQFADIGAVVDAILSKHGLSYRHKTVQASGKMTVTCILSHADGYAEENTLEGVEDKSGQKNANQAVGSTVTYLQRYTLKQALGIGATTDDDGQGGLEPDPVIEAEDILYVEQLIRDTESNLAIFLETIGAPSVAEMRMTQFKRAVALLNEKKRRATSGTTVG